jgi:mono/diheme cytochrome c family protein
MKTRPLLALVLFSTLPLYALARIGAHNSASPRATPAAAKRTTAHATSVAAFESMLPVLHNPRCMNCHMRGDFPRQGDDSHPHIMQVRRGPDGHGQSPVRCSTCHQDHNLAGLHMPPGAPDWALPPPTTPMIWQDLTPHQLCELFKDPLQNGHRTVSQIVDHMQTPLVLWGWHPGTGRKPIPTPQATFERAVKTWADNGAACPAP